MSTRIVNAIKNTTYYNCRNITSVDLQNIPWVNNSMYDAFHNCKNITTVNNINSNVTNMYQTFYGCTGLVNTPEIPNSVTDMYMTFHSCYGLVNAPEIPNSVTNMCYTFSRCYNLVNAPTIPSSVTDMNRTFDSCTNLVNAPEIPNSVTNIDYAFHDCTNLVNAPTIPNSVTLLYGTFRNCYNLVNTPIISNSVTNMRFCFSRCNNLVSITELPNSVISMSQAFIDCVNLIDIPNIPDSVTNMHCTFENCYNLVNAPKLSNSTTYAGSTFRNCHSLVNAPEIPNSVTYMHSTFYNCTNLTTAPDIPNAVTAMAYTFYLCNSLMGDIKILSNQITNAVNCFNGTTLTKNVYIPFKYENGVNTQTYNSFINAGYDENGTSCGVYLKDINAPAEVTLTIEPTPSDATVTFNTPGTVSGNSITVEAETDVTYIITKDGYFPSSEETVRVTSDMTINAPELQSYTIYESSNDYSSTINTTMTVPETGRYRITLVGGGSYQYGEYHLDSNPTKATGYTGGGGAGLIVDVNLDKETEYTLQVGRHGYWARPGMFYEGYPATDSSLSYTENNVTHSLLAGKGEASNGSVGGVGGVTSVTNWPIITTTLNANGNNGNYMAPMTNITSGTVIPAVAGAASVITGTNYGASSTIESYTPSGSGGYKRGSGYGGYAKVQYIGPNT